MDPIIKAIILNKKSTANDLASILLDFDDATVSPVMEIIINEIGENVHENLNIIYWMSAFPPNKQYLDSIDFQCNWEIIHKKLRRMVRKMEK